MGSRREDQIWARAGDNENAVGNLVLHLIGNTGQWIVSAVGGTDDIRHRDEGFNARGGVSKAELKPRLAARIAEVTAVIASVNDSRLAEQAHV